MKSSHNISFITTIYNEESTIQEFLQSVLDQTKRPDEIIIVDGGSTDSTVNKIKRLNKSFTVLIKKGNRSVGRNEAIKHASNEIIVCSDSGNILDKDWVKNITKPFQNKNVDVVAGYYKGIANNVFQKCIIPYALVMPDKVDPHNFLPATRSVAFTKKIWQKIAGFDEKLSHNEDYDFAKRLQKAKAKIVFKRDALVYWKPRNTFNDAFIMMYRFAYGDAEARIFRPKVLFIFSRYLIACFFMLIVFILNSMFLALVCVFLVLLYCLWAVLKNYKYVKKWQAVFILPVLQLIADWAVLKGTVLGLFGGKIRYN